MLGRSNRFNRVVGFITNTFPIYCVFQTTRYQNSRTLYGTPSVVGSLMIPTRSTCNTQHQTTDLLTSSGSTYPFTLAETKDMQRLVAEFIAHHRESSNVRGSNNFRGGSGLSNGIDVGARTIICESRILSRNLDCFQGPYERPLPRNTAYVHVFNYD